MKLEPLEQEIYDLIDSLAELGEMTEDMGNECFLCDYQPASGRRIQVKSKARGYRPPYAPPGTVQEDEIVDEAYPHEGSEDCIIARAMMLKKRMAEAKVDIIEVPTRKDHAPIA